MNDRIRRTGAAIIKKRGPEKQLKKVAEECSEFLVEFFHHEDGRENLDKLAEETADLCLVSEQARQIVKAKGGDVDGWIERKLTRLEGMIDG